MKIDNLDVTEIQLGTIGGITFTVGFSLQERHLILTQKDSRIFVPIDQLGNIINFVLSRPLTIKIDDLYSPAKATQIVENSVIWRECHGYRTYPVRFFGEKAFNCSNKIDIIKIFRKKFSLSLKDAKDKVEEILAEIELPSSLTK